MTWKLADSPFFDDHHRQLAERVAAWCRDNESWLHQAGEGDGDFKRHCRRILASLGEAGFPDYMLPLPDKEGTTAFDLRSICIIREGLAYECNLAASLCAVQGMGLSPLFRFGSDELKDAYIPAARRGEKICAIAISEMQAGSDVAAIETTAALEGDVAIVNGEKAWIMNGSIADHFLVLARSSHRDGGRPVISAFLIDADLEGVSVSANMDMIDGCPLATVAFDNVRVPLSHMMGSEGDGFVAAMVGFGIFRPSVGAAAVGLAKRALHEAMLRVKERTIFSRGMSELDGVQTRLADMLVDVETGSSAVYRAAWTGDVLSERFPTESALAKLVATEAAQRVVDSAVQLFGAMGVRNGSVVERLYREVRPMRIYEGTSEIQKKIIARNMLQEGSKA